MLLDADLPNGEQSSKFKKDVPLNNQSMKMPGASPGTLQFVKRMGLFLLWNQKYFLMDLIQLKTAKKLQKRFYLLCLTPFKKIMFSLKDASLNQTWSPMDLSTQRKNKIIL